MLQQTYFLNNNKGIRRLSGIIKPLKRIQWRYKI